MPLSRALIESIRERVADARDVWQTMDIELDHSPTLLLKAAGCDVAPMVYFSTPKQQHQYLGLGQWAVFNNQSAGTFLSQLKSKDVVLMGGQAFDSAKLEPGMPAEWWVLPVVVVIQMPKRRILRVMIPPQRDDAWSTIEPMLIKWARAIEQPAHHGAYTQVEHHPQKHEWLGTIDGVKGLFQTTALEKVVLARESQFVFDAPINPFAMMAVIQGHGPELHHFVMRFSSEAAFIGGTPERLFEINDGDIASDAIAGTIRNDVGATELLTRHKDANEHRYVSAFILSAMQGLCDGSIAFNKKPKLLTLRVISHLMQTFKGALRPGVGPFDAMAALHPTPAVAGTPTDLALGAIAQLEPFSRQWYAGPMGVVTASDSTVVVAIRSGLVKGPRVTLFAGAGIVAESDPNSEWDELNAKISGFEALFRS